MLPPFEREAKLMVMSASPCVQTVVYDHMAALEAETAILVPTTMAGALRVALEQGERIKAQALQIEAAKPARCRGQVCDATGGPAEPACAVE